MEIFVTISSVTENVLRILSISLLIVYTRNTQESGFFFQRFSLQRNGREGKKCHSRSPV